MYGRKRWNLKTSNKKFRLTLARTALEIFRKNKKAKYFLDLKIHLVRQNKSAREFTNWSLAGFGQEDEWNLTPEEYSRFEEAYNALIN